MNWHMRLLDGSSLQVDEQTFQFLCHIDEYQLRFIELISSNLAATCEFPPGFISALVDIAQRDRTPDVIHRLNRGLLLSIYPPRRDDILLGNVEIPLTDDPHPLSIGGINQAYQLEEIRREGSRWYNERSIRSQAIASHLAKILHTLPVTLLVQEKADLLEEKYAQECLDPYTQSIPFITEHPRGSKLDSIFSESGILHSVKEQTQEHLINWIFALKFNEFLPIPFGEADTIFVSEVLDCSRPQTEQSLALAKLIQDLTGLSVTRLIDDLYGVYELAKMMEGELDQCTDPEATYELIRTRLATWLEDNYHDEILTLTKYLITIARTIQDNPLKGFPGTHYMSVPIPNGYPASTLVSLNPGESSNGGWLYADVLSINPPFLFPPQKKGGLFWAQIPDEAHVRLYEIKARKKRWPLQTPTLADMRQVLEYIIMLEEMQVKIERVYFIYIAFQATNVIELGVDELRKMVVEAERKEEARRKSEDLES